jgi:hypothetical protein
MHRSRIGIVVVDHPEEVHDAALTFWAGVVGERADPSHDAPIQRIAELAGSLGLEVQRTGSGTPPVSTSTSRPTTSRPRSRGWPGSVRRSSRSARTSRCCATRGGLVFCVVGVQTDPTEFDRHARTWS